METRANYALIGIFTLAVVAAGFLFVLWFSGGDTGKGRQAVRIVFSGPVSGLSKGSVVTFNGLRVGEVTDLRLSSDDPRRVAAVIEIDRTVNRVGCVVIAHTPISVGTQLAGRRVTLRLEADLAHVIVDGQRHRTIALTIPPQKRGRLQGARDAGPLPAAYRRVRDGHHPLTPRTVQRCDRLLAPCASSWPSLPSRSSSPATSAGGPARAPPGQTTTTWSPLGYSAQRPRRVRAEQVGVPSGISPVCDDPEAVISTLVIAVGRSLLWRSRAGG